MSAYTSSCWCCGFHRFILLQYAWKTCCSLRHVSFKMWIYILANLRLNVPLVWLCFCFALDLLNKIYLITYPALRIGVYMLYAHKKPMHQTDRKDTRKKQDERWSAAGGGWRALLQRQRCQLDAAGWCLYSPQGRINPGLCSCLHRENDKLSSGLRQLWDTEDRRGEEPPLTCLLNGTQRQQLVFYTLLCSNHQ